MLEPLRWSSSGDLTALATANALLRLPAIPPAAATALTAAGFTETVEGWVLSAEGRL